MRRRILKGGRSLAIVAGMVLGFTLYFAAPTYAVPMLGVATDGPYSDGVGGNTLEPYQAFFADPDVSVAFPFEGFLIEGSGDTLHIFTNVQLADIYLVADATFTSNLSNLTFDITGDSMGPLDFISVMSPGIASYPTPYEAINLGPVTGDPQLGDGWFDLSDSAFNPQPYFQLEGILAFGGSLTVGGYLFAVADRNDNQMLDTTGRNHDKFSPKTTSATPIPEPGTLLLIGSGLVGIGAGARRRKKP